MIFPGPFDTLRGEGGCCESHASPHTEGGGGGYRLDAASMRQGPSTTAFGGGPPPRSGEDLPPFAKSGTLPALANYAFEGD